MDKQYVLMFSFLIILIVFGFVVSNNFSINDRCNVGETFFDMPKNYQLNSESIEHKNNYTSINITNKTNTITIVEYNNNDLDGYVNDYVNLKVNESDPVSLSEKNINGIKVKKSVNQNSKIFHYWFLNNNGKVYEIYSRDTSPDFEKNVELIINSKGSFI